MLYGRTPRLPPDINLLPPSTLSTTDNEFRAVIACNLLVDNELADQTLAQQKDTMVKHYNKTSREPVFIVGDSVFLHDPVKKPDLSKKIAPKYTGPYKVIEKKDPVLYRLEGLPQGMSTLIHANRLRLDPPPRLDSLHLEEDTLLTCPAEMENPTDIIEFLKKGTPPTSPLMKPYQQLKSSTLWLP